MSKNHFNVDYTLENICPAEATDRWRQDMNILSEEEEEIAFWEASAVNLNLKEETVEYENFETGEIFNIPISKTNFPVEITYESPKPKSYFTEYFCIR